MVTGQFSRTDFQSPLLDLSSDGTNLLRSAWVYLYGAQHVARLHIEGITELLFKIHESAGDIIFGILTVTIPLAR